MQASLFAALALMGVATMAASAMPPMEPLWPGGAPGAKGTAPEDVPSLQFFPASPEKSLGATVIVCPGGGYAGLADHEGAPVAQWLNSIGVNSAVLRYRLGPKYHHPCMMLDAQRAIRTVRARCASLGWDPKKIGILGFSAGGHLASTATTHFDAGDPAASDPIDRQSCRPDFSILIYPVITMSDPYTHTGSRTNLLGDNPAPELIRLLSNERHVTKETPPVFLVHTWADNGVPVQNSLMFATAMRRAGVPCELHMYEQGPHGFGLGTGNPILSQWPAQCAIWLRLHGLAK